MLAAWVPASAAAAGLTWADQRVTPGGPAGAFGNAAAIDGDVALVGAPFAALGGNADQGLLYVYHRDRTSGVWSQVAALTGSGTTAGSEFGTSVAIDGRYVIVGAPASGNGGDGSAYIFEREGLGIWVEKQRVQAPAVGAGGRFGDAVAISGPGNPGVPQDVRIVIGADGHDHGVDMPDSGAIYSGLASIVDGALQAFPALAQWESDAPAANGLFGASLALYRAPQGTMKPSTIGYLLVGEPGSGAVGVFRLYLDYVDGNSFQFEQRLQLADAVDSSTPVNFGYAIGMSRDGYRAAISAPSETDGARPSRVAVFDLSTDDWQWHQDALLPPGAAENDYFGRSLSFGHGWLLVGVPWYDGLGYNTGAGMVFGESGGGWSLVRTLQTEPGHGASLGAAAAITTDGTVLLGASIAQSAHFYTSDDEIFAAGFDGDGP
ncbi:MAG TPA: hypothetical protein VFG73_08970 [Rhodanobacteraceae bacterium]|nr:hypothetical protein [Rhodanobacteraceae bacterium]